MSQVLTIPRMASVDSSNIESIGYNPERNELHVRFKNGGHYIYEGVTGDQHRDMMTAESKSKFLNDHVKGKHGFRKH